MATGSAFGRLLRELSPRAGFGLDMRRLLVRRLSLDLPGLRRFAWENLVQPLVVAAVVVWAFLSRDRASDFREPFIYFSTLYAFWVGMFGCCQALNRELETSEWSYWVLGFRRSPWRHVLAAFSTSVLFAGVQVAVFLFGLWMIGRIDGTGWTSLVNDFVTSAPGEFSPLFQMGGALNHWLAVKGALLPFAAGQALFALALFSALLSGAGFGLLFSALVDDSVVSLNVSVGFVVLLGMLSLCGLRGPSGSTAQLDRDFLPAVERTALEAVAPLPPGHSDGRLEYALMLSRVLPQRYFFNLGRMLSDHRIDRRALGRIARASLAARGVPPERTPPWMRTGLGDVYCPNPINGTSLKSWVGAERPDDDDRPASEFLRACVRADPGVVDRQNWGLGIWAAMLGSAVLAELLPLVGLFAFCSAFTLLLVYMKKGSYGNLR